MGVGHLVEHPASHQIAEDRSEVLDLVESFDRSREHLRQCVCLLRYRLAEDELEGRIQLTHP